MDSLAMFFGAKKRKSPMRKSSSHGSVMVGTKVRKLHKGKNGGLYYRTKSGKAYVDAAFVRKHKVAVRKSPRRSRRSPRRSPKRKSRRSPRRSPKRKSRRSPRRSPKRKSRRSPRRSRRSPRRSRRSPMRRSRWGYGLGQPSLLDMMGPANLM